MVLFSAVMAMPSFDLRQHHQGPLPGVDIIVGTKDLRQTRPLGPEGDNWRDCHDLYGMTPQGKDFIAYLQEVDDVEPLGDWSCRISRRDFDAYGFDLATGRGLTLCACIEREDRLEWAQLVRAD